jgi:hypothetical protein
MDQVKASIRDEVESAVRNGLEMVSEIAVS